jgi:hypothetical protein
MCLIGSVIGVWAYIDSDAPSGYHKGNSTNLSFALSMCAVCTVLMLWQQKENKKRAQGERDYRLEKVDAEK